MPGMGMCMMPAIRVEPRIEQRLEQRITMQCLALALRLDEEGGIGEQREILEKIMKDLGNGVYTDVNNFYDRVMKRIKKKNRTVAVKSLIKSLRELIDTYRESSKPINLHDIEKVAGLGLDATNDMYHADSVFRGIRRVSCRVSNPLEDIVGDGKEVLTTKFSPSAFYNATVEIEDKTNGEVKTQEGYDRVRGIMQAHPQNKKIPARMLREVTIRREKYNRQKIEVLWKLMDQTSELAVANDPSYTLIPASDLISREGLEEIIRKNENTPLPILSELLFQGVDEKTLEKMNEYSGVKDFRKSRDNKRAVLSALVGIRNYRFGTAVIEDIIKKSNGFRQARDILARFSALSKMGNAHYSFKLENGDEIMKYLNRKTFQNPVLNQIDPKALEMLEQRLSGNLPDDYWSSYNPILKLGTLYADEHPGKIKLLAELMESLLFGKFEELRYSDKQKKEQIGFLDGNTKEWIANSRSRRMLGDVRAVEPHYKAVRDVVERLKQDFKESYGIEINQDTLEDLKRKRQEFLSPTKTIVGEGERDVFGVLGKMDSQIKYAQTVINLEETKLENFLEIKGKISGCLDKFSTAEFRAGIDDIFRIMNTKEAAGVQPVYVVETDDPNITINVGCVPVRSCQRWTERTGYNDCLMAYVLDANKRVLQVVDEKDRVRVRSIERLLHPKEIDRPTIFIERPYADIHNEEMFRALLSGAIEKAHRMSKETGMEIAVAVADSTYKNLLKEMAKNIEVKYHRASSFHARFPKSINDTEYSDAFGMKVREGLHTASDVGYVVISSDE